LTLPRPLARDQNRVPEIRLEGRAAIAGMTPHGELGMWQRRYWEHTIRDDQDFAADTDYTHFNPAKDGLVGHPADWLHSSFRPRVASGLYPAGWVGGSAEPQEAGERR
jgi:putative transposase